MKWFVLWNDVPGMYSKYSSSGFSGFSPFNPTYWFTTKIFSNVIRVYIVESCFDAAVKVLINPKIFILQNKRGISIRDEFNIFLKKKWNQIKVVLITCLFSLSSVVVTKNRLALAWQKWRISCGIFFIPNELESWWANPLIKVGGQQKKYIK